MNDAAGCERGKRAFSCFCSLLERELFARRRHTCGHSQPAGLSTLPPLSFFCFLPGALRGDLQAVHQCTRLCARVFFSVPHNAYPGCRRVPRKCGLPAFTLCCLFFFLWPFIAMLRERSIEHHEEKKKKRKKENKTHVESPQLVPFFSKNNNTIKKKITYLQEQVQSWSKHCSLLSSELKRFFCADVVHSCGDGLLKSCLCIWAHFLLLKCVTKFPCCKTERYSVKHNSCITHSHSVVVYAFLNPIDAVCIPFVRTERLVQNKLYFLLPFLVVILLPCVPPTSSTGMETG